MEHKNKIIFDKALTKYTIIEKQGVVDKPYLNVLAGDLGTCPLRLL
jgi:hypothetical protein